MLVLNRFPVVLAVVIAAGVTIGTPSHAPGATFGYGEFHGEFQGNGKLEDDDLQLIATTEGGGQGDVEFTMTEFKNDEDGEPIGGAWEYLADSTIDLVLSVKYGQFFSLFRYPSVEIGQSGLFASDPALTGFDMSTNANGQPFAISEIRAYTSVIPVPPAVLLFLTGVAALIGFTRARRP